MYVQGKLMTKSLLNNGKSYSIRQSVVNHDIWDKLAKMFCVTLLKYNYETVFKYYLKWSFTHK